MCEFKLCSGNFAVVRLATRKDNNEKVAIKIIDKELCQGKEEMIETEVRRIIYGCYYQFRPLPLRV